jgi:Cu(I)/Ag(I) efflux system protein CusF
MTHATRSRLRPLAAALAVSFCALCAAQARAQTAPASAPPAAGAAQVELTAGEIRKVDKAAAKLTIRHGEIRNLDMPPMTMVFQVKEPPLLDRVKAGDKVRFRAEKVGDAYVVTVIEVAP